MKKAKNRVFWTKDPIIWSERKIHLRKIKSFLITRSCAALRAADLDWIVGPEYSLGRNKQKRHPGGVTTDLGGG